MTPAEKAEITTCDGSSTCPADKHIQGCFRSKPEPENAAPFWKRVRALWRTWRTRNLPWGLR